MIVWLPLPKAKRDLAVRMRELRHRKKWSQERLAEEASIHRTYLAGIEGALRNPSLEIWSSGRTVCG